MSKTLTKLSKIISESPLNPSDQNDLLVFLPALPEKLLNDLTDIFEKRPELVEDFNRNFQSKIDVLINGRNQFEKLAEEEEKMLEEEEKRLLGKEEMAEEEEKEENFPPI